ncbi:ferredoxin-type protein NapF [Lonepinella sp. BR2930]|uniref:ferredoxin-type protein NapF n=1 Tax=Lonepinella sp. BR2930 TaxID=3434554 RepID=UPI003F6DFB6D
MQTKDQRYYQAYLSHQQISRRGLLRSMWHAVEKNDQHNKRTIARPPFAAKESLFLTACTGCGECVTACSLGLISVTNQKAVLDLSYTSCSFCGECAKHCPTNALHISFKADTGLRPVFNADCLLKQQQACTTCQLSCPQQAITPDLTIDDNRCNGCGECQSACFMNAIRLCM